MFGELVQVEHASPLFRDWRMDYTTGESRQIRRIPNINDPPNWEMASCGSARNEEGERLAVFAGGKKWNSFESQHFEIDETAIFNVDQGIWQPGPPLPHAEDESIALQYEDSFLFIGRQEILRFNPSGHGSWENIGFEFPTDCPQNYFWADAATLVPRSYLDCEDDDGN